MVVLPILFWCGYTNLGGEYAIRHTQKYDGQSNLRDRMVHVHASGVFFSGFLKDMWRLPRPLSPPLNRITMSKSATLEYGFPSTHSTNAVSVAVYALFMLNSSEYHLLSSLGAK